MNILFDHNVPKKLRNALLGSTVKTAKEMGWTELKNGDLLRAAEIDKFELIVTCDQNLSYQQNLTGRNLALVILNTNNWNVLQRNLRVIMEAVDAAEPGSFRFLNISR